MLPRSCCLPPMTEGSTSALELSRPARASLTLQPVGSLSSPRLLLSRGSGSASYPAKPPVSFRTNRQLSGWDLPPQVGSRLRGARSQPSGNGWLTQRSKHLRNRTSTILSATPCLPSEQQENVAQLHDRRRVRRALVSQHRHVHMRARGFPDSAKVVNYTEWPVIALAGSGGVLALGPGGDATEDRRC